MRRKVFFAVVLASCAGLLAAGAVASSAIFSTSHATTQASATHAKTHNAKATVITVVAGKPSELAFQLSKSTKLAVGTYIFKVTNRGLGFHTFKLCTAPVKTAAKNACVGKATRVLHPGQSATLTVTIKKTGKYEYLCSIPGHAAAGMKGLIGVGVAVKAAPKPPTITSAAVITVIAGKPSELAFQLSMSTKLEVGTYIFKVTNRGLGFHTFKFCTAPVKTAAKNTCVGKVTRVLHPGQSATLTVTIKKAGKYEYLCSIPGHAAAGMKGLIGVGVAVKAAPKPPTTTPPTTTPTGPPATTTTTASGPPTANGCPYGTPKGTTIGSDEDGDESAAGQDDGDGCL